MTLVIDVASWVFVLLGSFFVLAGALGMVRMPEIFTRMHAVSVIDTLGVGFLMLGMALQAGLSLVALKLLFLVAVYFFIGPVVTHALAQACLHERIEPLLTEDRRAARAAQIANEGAETANEGRPS